MERRTRVISGSIDAEARRASMKLLLEREGVVMLAPTAESLGVSEMTIRRDLLELEQAGIARRVRGGAVAVGPQLFQRRQGIASEAKQVIAAKLLTLLPERGAIVIDASSTMHRFAASIDATDLTVVTTGVESHAALSHREGIRAILTGGELERSTGALIGPSAERTIREYVYERAFISPTFIDAELGATEQTAEGAEVKRTMRFTARSLVVALDSTKLDNSVLARLFGLDDIDLLVTELDPADPLLEPYRDRVAIL